MANFPPAKGSKNNVKVTNPDSTMITTGKTIAQSLAAKDKGIVPTPGVEKNVNLF